MAYKPRLTAPSKTNKFYYKNNPFYQSGYGLPNCTCYAYGRFYEVLGEKPKLSLSNAENWYSHKDGYDRGKTPKLGAVICWRKGKAGYGADGAGHVAVVENVYPDGSILIGQSGWGASKTFWTQKIKPPYAFGSAYTFQGFIYNPAVKEKPKPEGKTYSGTFPTLPKRGYFKKGDKGEQVEYLQKFLNWAIGAGLTVDGKLGKKTIEAVKAFQKKHYLVVDGKFGKNCLTMAKTIRK